MSLFGRGEHHTAEDAGAASAGASVVAPAAADEAPTAPAESPLHAPFSVPPALREFGLASWFIIGLAIVALGVLFVVGELFTLFVPTLFAALLAATFMPVADALERRGMKRWLAALLVMILIVLIFVAVVAVVVFGVVREFPTISQNLTAAAADVSSWLESHDVQLSFDQIKAAVQKAAPSLEEGMVTTVLHGLRSVSGLVFGIFIGINILVYFLADGRRIGRFVSRHMGPVPQPVAYRIVANSARFLRGYIWGSTLIGLFNGAVVFVGALILGTPLAATIFIVNWFTNYIPMFGAIIGGAFAVLIALASGGITDAVLMLVFVLIANGPLQTVVSQFALGAALKLHPLAVLFVTTAGAILFGALGGIVAAPFLKIALDARRQLIDAGLFDDPAASGRGSPWPWRGGGIGGGRPPHGTGPPAEPAAGADTGD